MFYFALGYNQPTNNAVMVSGKQQRDLPLASRLPHNTGLSTQYIPVGYHELSSN